MSTDSDETGDVPSASRNELSRDEASLESEPSRLQFEERVREILEGEVVEEDVEKVGEQIVRVMMARLQYHSGPLPSAEVLAAYKDVDPRLLDEVLQGAGENRSHRISMDIKLANTAKLSLILTWIAVMLLVCGGLTLAFLDHPVAGSILTIAGFSPVLVTMIRGGGTWTGRGDDGRGSVGDDQDLG